MRLPRTARRFGCELEMNSEKIAPKFSTETGNYPYRPKGKRVLDSVGKNLGEANSREIAIIIAEALNGVWEDAHAMDVVYYKIEGGLAMVTRASAPRGVKLLVRVNEEFQETVWRK